MSKYTIVKDTGTNEYGLLYKENFGKVLKDDFKSYDEIAPTLTPEHLFYNGSKKVDPDADPTKDMPKDVQNIGVPVVHFYDSNKKVYDTAMYTSKEAEKKYELIKDVTTKDQFFKYVEAKSH